MMTSQVSLEVLHQKTSMLKSSRIDGNEHLSLGTVSLKKPEGKDECDVGSL